MRKFAISRLSLQQVKPDIILLLNEFDYIADPAQGVKQLFLDNYLAKSQQHGGHPTTISLPLLSVPSIPGSRVVSI